MDRRYTGDLPLRSQLLTALWSKAVCTIFYWSAGWAIGRRRSDLA